ncbi:DUF4432 family protein [Microbacterium kyungheense]|uniref:Uncharacterized protein DUF4432 n=1 Tax=Microbacterium kyungheense TaxID=1263636 RepID=A0A543FK22_9MICO|nr:DUF4432 family protein [Microbacterium kyungheense]TQM34229.1 uncharacterized protein DUF4432 [Microbacterium kyungheense]
MPISIASAALTAIITPERGADIVQIIDRATATPLLAESPTRGVGTSEGSATDSTAAWLRGYPGGWQLLVPNAGPERDHDGVRQGYHGEASLAAWDLVTRDESSCTLETDLLTAPLRLRRRVSVEGEVLTVTDEIENLSPDPVETRIVQHPAFGAPFLDDRSYLVTAAETIVTDAAAPGTLAARDVVGRPGDVLPAGPVRDSIHLPGPGSTASLFAALTGFATPEATFCSPTAGIAVRLAWDGEALPHAWFWIEAHAGSGWPWFRRLYAIAVEPANVLPGDGDAPPYLRGGNGTLIAAGETLTLTTSLTRLPLPPD